MVCSCTYSCSTRVQRRECIIHIPRCARDLYLRGENPTGRVIGQRTHVAHHDYGSQSVSFMLVHTEFHASAQKGPFPGVVDTRGLLGTVCSHMHAAGNGRRPLAAKLFHMVLACTCTAHGREAENKLRRRPRRLARGNTLRPHPMIQSRTNSSHQI